MAASTLTCMFFTATFPAREKGEDIISRWYAKAIGHPMTATVLFGLVDATASVASDPVASQTVAANQFRAPDACPACNGGWMSQIENHIEATPAPDDERVRGQSRPRGQVFFVNAMRITAPGLDVIVGRAASGSGCVGPADATAPPPQRSTLSSAANSTSTR